MPVEFPYPKEGDGWSTGSMRKKKGYTPDFDYAFGATAPRTVEATPEQIAFDAKAPKLKKASGEATAVPSDQTMGELMARQAGGTIGLATTILGRLGRPEPTEDEIEHPEEVQKYEVKKKEAKAK